MLERLEQCISKYLTLTPPEWVLVRRSVALRQVQKRELLLRAGETCRYIAFVNAGCLRCFYQKDGKEITAYFQTEDMFSADYHSFLSQSPATRSIEAIEPSQVLLIGYEQMQRLYDQIPAWEKLMRLISESLLLENQQRAASLLLDRPEERYLNLLKDTPDVVRRVPLHFIASYLGITPEALSRIRSRIRNRRSA